jgi:membrane-bound lytic murein transglycosylase A
LFLLVVVACTPAVVPKLPGVEKKAELKLSPVSFTVLEGWATDNQSAALGAFLQSCTRIEAAAPERPLGGKIKGTLAALKMPCALARQLNPGDDGAARRFFEQEFVPYRVADGPEPLGLFTGYFEPELNGALKPGSRYAIPLFGRPKDLVTVDLGLFREALKGERLAGRVEDGVLKPYPARAEITQGVLDGQAPILAWADNPIDVFFLQIQGSGRLRLPDGTLRRLGYDSTNGRPFLAIGRVLIERGAVSQEDVSMQAIRHWLDSNPSDAEAVMNLNQSFVFFRWIDHVKPADGPLGAEGVPLSAGRSLAVDRRFLPFGLPLWLETSASPPTGAPEPYHRLMIAQDTGGAITGPVRGDIFFGTGAEAGERAGRMKAPGHYFLLLPRTLDSALERD